MVKKRKKKKNKKLPLKSFVAIVVCVAVVFAFIISMGKSVRPFGEDFDIWEQYYAEEENSIDAVVIGASSIYRYWIPTQAYEEKGFTSYLLAHSGQPFETIPYVMKEAAKTQDVKLFVVEIRKAYVDASRKANGTFNQASSTFCLSKVTSGMNPSLNRTALINSTLVTDDKNSKFEWVFSFLKYHENLLKFTEEQKEARKNLGTHEYKSNRQSSAAAALDLPNYDKSKVVELDKDVKKNIDKVAKTAKKLGAEVLFVSTPFVPTTNRYPYLQATVEYINNQGYDLLDCTFAYKTIGLKLAKDFYNNNHCNIHGAKKFTTYLDNYIQTNYNLQSNLSETAKDSWDKAVEKWSVKEDALLKEWYYNVQSY